MSETEPEVVDRPLEVCELVHFYPSEQMRRKYGWPDARYAAICIGTQQNKQPILRVMSPIPSDRKRKKGRVNLPPISINHEKSGLRMDVGGFASRNEPQTFGVDRDGEGAAFVSQDLTVWCDEDATYGTWERSDAGE